MKDIFIAILIAVFASFSTSVFDRIFREYNPDTKKLISKTKKFLNFIVKYVLPIIFLIYFFINREFNKTFVLIVSIIITMLFCNLLIDYNRLIEKDIINYIKKLNINSMNLTEELNTNSMNLTKEISSILIKSSNESTKNKVKAIDNLIQSKKNTNKPDTEQTTNIKE